MTITYKTKAIAMWVGAALSLCSCASSPRLAGSVHRSTYTSSEGRFSVPFPVSAEIGGRVLNDTAEMVTFHDNWGSRITFSGLPVAAHSSIISVLQKDGKEKALTEFAKRQYSDLITVHYHPELRDGMISFINLRPNSPKTAVAIFLHGSQLYIVETDMLPGVQLLAQNDAKSVTERETWLEGRAMALAQSIEPR
jgi:hypothetical protein